MAEHRLSYTASEIDERLGKVSSLVAKINGITPDLTGNVTLPIDTSIQQNSTNPVTGGALYNELSGFAEGVMEYVESNIPTKTSQLTNDSGFITGIPSEYITESELTAKGYATQTSVDALSNRIDNLPSGEGSSIIIDSEFSLTSTNPLQNKVVAEAFQNVQSEFETMQNKIDNLSANGGKTLISEFDLNSSNLTASTTEAGRYSTSTELQETLANVFTTLHKGFDVLAAEFTIDTDIIGGVCTYDLYDDTTNGTINFTQISGICSNLSEDLVNFTLLKNYFLTNISEILNDIFSAGLSVHVKLYTISGGTSGSGGGVQPDWNQNDSSAPDYIKNRPFYKETETVFDEDVTTVVDENDGMIIYEHDSSIIDLESVQDGDLFEVIFGDMAYLYEIKDIPFLGNFYLFIEQQAAGLDMTIEEYLELMSQYAPEIVELAVDTGEDFIIMLDTESTMFMTREAGTYHFAINGVTNVKKLDSSMIDWAGGGAPSGLPEVTTEDNDKVLMVVDGKWTVSSIANGDEVYY